jgi:hypothetical protein
MADILPQHLFCRFSSHCTAVTQIGQSFGGVTLTEQQYKRVEPYVNAALAFLGEGGLTAVKVEGLENSRRQLLTFHDGEDQALFEAL